ncbi:LCP family protein [Saccharothrix sp. S26]|uniref:LCP family protein n=1 Tax=Saccharothrix sp. S26 TaxID=2907215 RepID=UPI001F3CC046|nr:LCP family protein [Saccharothrix sp. S26]MCE6999004.1 LCP family protein [Saccharothrix sp. S26]
MTDTRQEALIREAIAAEADQAVDHRSVLANLHGKRSRRRPIALFAAAGLTAAAAAVAVIVPLSVDRTASAPPAGQVTPTARTVLLIGTDGAGNTDSIVLARVGDDGTTSAAWLPRDAVVDLPGVGPARLSSAYGRAVQRVGGPEGDRAGAEALTGAVESLTGVEVDHHVTLDMAGLVTLADAVGGVDVCLRRPVRDPLSGVDLPNGPVSLNGAQALAFLRQRNGLRNGDLDRIVRQQLFLRALGAKVVGGGDPARLARVVEAARSAVRTDPGWDLPEFARRLTPAVRTAIIPLGEEVAVGLEQGRAVDPAAVRAFAAEFFAEGATGTPTGGHSIPLPATETEEPGRQPSERDCVN